MKRRNLRYLMPWDRPWVDPRVQVRTSTLNATKPIRPSARKRAGPVGALSMFGCGW
jgi:hypothetical protein